MRWWQRAAAGVGAEAAAAAVIFATGLAAGALRGTDAPRATGAAQTTQQAQLTQQKGSGPSRVA